MATVVYILYIFLLPLMQLILLLWILYWVRRGTRAIIELGLAMRKLVAALAKDDEDPT